MIACTIPRLFDAHVHFREGDVFPLLVRLHAQYCGRAHGIGNTKNPQIADAATAAAYCARAEASASSMVTYVAPMLGPRTTRETIRSAKAAGVLGFKLMLKGTSTHSEYGVHDVWELREVLEEMHVVDLVLLIHGELPGYESKEAEEEFLPTLEDLSKEYPRLRIILEHITTASGVAMVESLPENITGTITAHHLFLTRDDVRDKDGVIIRPENYCLPEPKIRRDREALILAALYSKKIGFGSDSAIHNWPLKIAAKPMPGSFTAPTMAASLMEIFDRHGEQDRLRDFTSVRMSRFYQQPLPRGTITFIKRPWIVPDAYAAFDGDEEFTDLYGDDAAQARAGEAVGGRMPWFVAVPFRAGETLPWQASSLHLL